MNYFALLKKIDTIVGTLLCLLFSPFYRARRDTAVPEHPKVCIIKFWGMGSILLCSPAIRAIRERLQPSELTIITLDKNREVCESLGLFTRVLSCRLKPLPVFIWQLVRNVIELRRSGVDFLFDFEFFTHFTALTTFFINARRNVGFSAAGIQRGNFYAITAPFESSRYIVDIYLSLVGKVIPGALSGVFVQPAADEAILAAHGLEKNGYLVINPNSDPIGLERRWPKGYFAELVDRIQEEYSMPVVLIGGRREAAYNEAIRQACKKQDRLINLGGKTRFSELAALIKCARLVITNDSGPLHLATVFDTPSVSFFGPETPVIYGPRGNRHTVLYRNMYCSPCINVHKAKELTCVRGRAECLLQIGPDDAWTAVQENLKEVSA